MTITARSTARERVPMDTMRRTALVAGGLYLVTFIAGIPPAFILYNDVLNDSAYIVGAGNDTAVLWGGFLEIINAVACIGTAVVLFPVIKRQSEPAALGFVTARVIEAAVIFVGVISLFSVVTLRQDLAGAAGVDADSLVTTGQSLVAIHEWASLFGPGLIPGVNALLLGYVMYRSGLVPRVIPLMGLIGAPFFLIAASASILGFNEQVSVWSAIVLPPIFFWELSLGLWLVVKGFKPSPITARALPSIDRDAELSPA
jgi:hypothetical protein